MAFAFLGLVSAMVQGGLIRRLVPRFGEPRLIVAGIATLAVGFVALTVVASWPALLAATLVVGVGQGLASPTISGLLSRTTPEGEQGAVFGTLSSAQTLARMINYSVANLLLVRVGPSAPYWEAAAVAAVALLLASRLLGRREPIEVAVPPGASEAMPAGRGGVTSALNPRMGQVLDRGSRRWTRGRCRGSGSGRSGRRRGGDEDLDRLDQASGRAVRSCSEKSPPWTSGRSWCASISRSRRASRSPSIGRRSAIRRAAARRPSGSVRAQSNRGTLTIRGRPEGEPLAPEPAEPRGVPMHPGRARRGGAARRRSGRPGAARPRPARPPRGRPPRDPEAVQLPRSTRVPGRHREEQPREGRRLRVVGQEPTNGNSPVFADPSEVAPEMPERLELLEGRRGRPGR